MPEAPTRLPHYTELAPSPSLAPWVECYWSIRATDAPAFPNRVVPDGCSDLIIGVANDPTPMVVGTMRTAIVIPASGRIDLFGIRFHPGAALPLLGTPLQELTDRRVALEEIWGPQASAFVAVGETTALAERVARAERLLARHLAAWADHRRADEAMVREAISLLRRARGGVGVAQVAAALGVGERRLERAFGRSVGLSPKALDKVLRFRRVLRALDLRRHGGDPAWAAIAAGAGYADQSHFIRDFKSLAGLTPSRYLAERRDVGFVQYAEEEAG